MENKSTSELMNEWNNEKNCKGFETEKNFKVKSFYATQEKKSTSKSD